MALDEFGGTIVESPSNVDEFGGTIVPLEDVKIPKEDNFPRMGVFPSNTIGDVAAAASYGALQEIGRVPGLTLEAIIQGAQAYDKLAGAGGGFSLGSEYARPSTEAMNESILRSIDPIQDLTPKLFEAAGVPTNYPTSPQFQFPTVAAGGELATLAIPSIAGKISEAIAGPKAMSAIDFGRSVRSAVKSSNPRIASRVEEAASNQYSDIFHANPNADTIAASPFEGFADSVSSVKKGVENQLDELRSRIGGTLNGGDEIASALEKEANALKSAGEPSSTVQLLMDRANDLKGKGSSIGDLQRTTTLANNKLSPFFQKNLVSQSPASANAENIANKIISQTGGGILNKEMEKVGGKEGAALRKKWADLNTLEQESLARVNKIINKADPEIQSAAAAALTSTKGVAGLFAMVNGHPSGILGVGAAVLEKFQKNAAKELSSSNSIITKTYNSLRKSPPAAPKVFSLPDAPVPKTLTPEELRNIEIARSSSAPIAAPQVNLQNIIQQRLSELNAATGNQPLVRPNPGSTFSPPSAAETSDFLTRTIQDSLERAAREKAIREAGSTLGFF